MAHEFRLPDIGEGLVEAQIVRWLVDVGDQVRVDQPVVEVETDKTVVELPSPYAGVVLHHGAAEGEALAVGEVLVVVGQPGETWPPTAGGNSASPGPVQRNGGGADDPQPGRRDGGDAPPIVGSLSEEAQDLTRRTPPPDRGFGRPQALPKVRRLARELGVDLAAVAATRPKGRVTAEDIAAAARAGGAGTPSPAERALTELGAGRHESRLSPSPASPTGDRDAGPAAPPPRPARPTGDHDTGPAAWPRQRANPRPGRPGPTLSPVVRRLADDLGVDLGSLAGTGPGGRVTRDDVLAAASAAGGEQAATAPVSAVAAAPPAHSRGNTVRGPDPIASRLAATGDAGVGDVPASSGARRGEADERRRLSPMRRAIAGSVSRSWAEIPQVTAFDEVDATRLLGVRKALQARHGVQLSMDALLVAAVVPALRAFPEINARLEGDELVLPGTQDVGIAVDTPDGLLIAVVRDAGGKDLLDLAAEVRRLGERGRARALVRADLSGQGFTVSNIGGVGGGFGTPLVPAGTVGILSVGQARDKPVARAGNIGIAPMMPLSLSYDHRVIDGATGRQFLAMVMENLTEPALFLL